MPPARSPQTAFSRRELAGDLLVRQGTKLGAVGVLAALLGTAEALGWLDVGSHHAAEMGYPTLCGAALMAGLAALGLVVAPPASRTLLLPSALIWLGAAALVGCWGAWLLVAGG